MRKGKSRTLRTLVALAVVVIIGVGFMLNTGIGTLSAVGWFEISILCPLGALGTMLASKLLVPQAVISLVVAVVLILLFGRVFCGWVCPVPLVQKVRNIFGPAGKKEIKDKKNAEEKTAEEGVAHASSEGDKPVALSKKEEAALKGCASDCGSCATKREKIDSRHFILGGSLLSAAIFGFPVFCLVCPIGLTFASILLGIRLFSGGDVTLSLLVVPALLIVEVLVFRKWCHKLCPLSAFMSLIAKANRTFQPSINDSKCIETAQGRECGLCGKACEEGIDPRHPELGIHAMNECTRCRACVDICPGEAISIPLLAKNNAKAKEKEALGKS